MIEKRRKLIDHNRGEQYLPKHRVYLVSPDGRATITVQAQDPEDAKEQATYFAEDNVNPIHAEEYEEGERTPWDEILDAEEE